MDIETKDIDLTDVIIEDNIFTDDVKEDKMGDSEQKQMKVQEASNKEEERMLQRYIKDIIRKMNIQQQNFTIVILGSTGSGKSTLINVIFGSNIAPEGDTKPTTMVTVMYPKPGTVSENYPLRIYDTRGLELSLKNSEKETAIEQLFRSIDEARGSDNIIKQIDIAWLTLTIPPSRLEKAHVEVIRHLCYHHIPIVIVITQAIMSDEVIEKFKHNVNEQLRMESIKPVPIIAVLAKSMKTHDGNITSPYGVDELLNTTLSLVPKGKQATLVALQKVSVNAKLKLCDKYIIRHVIGSIAAGAIPLPFSDALIITPIQASLIGCIANAFYPGKKLDFEKMVKLIAVSLPVEGILKTGGTFLANCLKMIPGVGSITGGIISASIAGSLTALLGVSAKYAFAKYYESNHELDDVNMSAIVSEMENNIESVREEANTLYAKSKEQN